MNKLLFQVLGSGACERVPAPFCDCRVCRHARQFGGHDCRSTTAYRLGDTVRFDLGPDAFLQNQRYHLDSSKIARLFFTHSHDDHFLPSTFDALNGPKRLIIYGNAAIQAALANSPGREGFDMQLLQAGDQVELPEYQATVLAVPTYHIPTEQSLMYRIDAHEHHLLIANDSDEFPEDTYHFLQGVRLDHLFIDCTWGLEDRRCGHMGWPNDLRVFARLRECGAADAHTRIHPIHFGHVYGNVPAAELNAAIGRLGSAAYDGMRLWL